jgi:hypothetical protein
LPKAASGFARAASIIGPVRPGFDHPHAAPAAAPAGLEHQRVTDVAPGFGAFGMSGGKAGGRHHRHTGGHGHAWRAATLLPSVRMTSGLGPMKAMPAAASGLGKVGVLGQEAVARVDRVDLGLFGDADDVVNVEVGLRSASLPAPTR